jgi:hypothetical protein
MRILVLGYGKEDNQCDCPIRNLVAQSKQWVEHEIITSVDFRCQCQFTDQDIEQMDNYDVILFICIDPDFSTDYEIIKISTRSKNDGICITGMTPKQLIQECTKVHKKQYTSYLLRINGKDYKYTHPMRQAARENFNKAFVAVKYKLLTLVSQ